MSSTYINIHTPGSHRFHWIRIDDPDISNASSVIDPLTMAYVRKLASESLTLIPATEAVIESPVIGDLRKEIVTYDEIASVQLKTFAEKVQWFLETSEKLRVDWDLGHMRVCVRRDHLLEDSLLSVLSVSRKDLRKNWKIHFIGEEEIIRNDYEVAREWFQLVTEEVFNPNNGLWKPSAESPLCMDINPASAFFHPENDLRYFRFIGRLLAKAIFDHMLVSGHMCRYLYKHLVGWPVTFDDVEHLDIEIYNFLRQAMHFDADMLEQLKLFFTTKEDCLGESKTIELVEGGSKIDVTRYNLAEYIEFRVKYQLLGRVQRQLQELLLGFFDLMEEPLLSVFDFQEIELLLCGLPEINILDWKENTQYSGEYESLGEDHPVCRWFWEVVEEYDVEHRARLLQFITGTSAVPSKGFFMLQATDGKERKFTIEGLSMEKSDFPSVHQ